MATSVQNLSASRLTMFRLKMVQVDVFTDRALTGNSLAVFLDGRGLSTEQMQALAREMNLSETTFILPRDAATEKVRGVRVRIFTVQEELPFAGHPTLGTAFVLHGQTGSDEVRLNEVRLDLDAGTIPVNFTADSGDGRSRKDSPRVAFGEMRQKDPEFGVTHDVQAVASLTNVSAADFDDSVPIQTVSTGLPYTIATLRSLRMLQNLRLDMARASEYLARSGGKFFYFVCRETVNPKARLHARMIFYGGDDPATGSAAGCCSAWMVANAVAASDEQVLIEQGLEVHRPSSIFVRATKRDNQIVNVRVGGNCVEVLRAEVAIEI